MLQLRKNQWQFFVPLNWPQCPDWTGGDRNTHKSDVTWSRPMPPFGFKVIHKWDNLVVNVFSANGEVLFPRWKRDMTWHGKGRIRTKYHKIDFFTGENREEGPICGWKSIKNPNLVFCTAHILHSSYSSRLNMKVRFDHNWGESMLKIVLAFCMNWVPTI